jgi:hypothetical protein
MERWLFEGGRNPNTWRTTKADYLSNLQIVAVYAGVELIELVL